MSVFGGIPAGNIRVYDLHKTGIIFLCQLIQWIDHSFLNHFSHFIFPPANRQNIRQTIRTDERIQHLTLITAWHNEIYIYSRLIRNRPGHQILSPVRRKPGIIDIPLKCSNVFLLRLRCGLLLTFLQAASPQQQHCYNQGKSHSFSHSIPPLSPL